MRFTEEKIKELDLTNADNFVKLIIEYLCGEKYNKELSSNDRNFVKNIIRRTHKNGINYEQFNEVLLLLNQDRVSNDFFKFFFEKEKKSLDYLKEGVIKFRGFAMLCIGNFRFAYKQLINLDETEIKNKLKPYWKSELECRTKFNNRPPKMLKIEKIKKDETWYIGELTGSIIKRNLDLLKSWSPPEQEKLSFLKFEKEILKMDKARKKNNKIARRNTDIYLTWDYMDVYIATSMRHKWQFIETFNFIKKVFDNKLLKKLNIRYFDPTQSKCTNPRDKGLLEGLMLKRTLCTIYMAQESDTMGKDSELAATLAQSTPVIAYVPKINLEKYSKKIEEYPLDFFRKRLLILKAEGIFDELDCVQKLKTHDKNYEEIIGNFLEKLDKYQKSQPFSLWFEMDNREFKQKCKDFNKVCFILAIAESYNFDSRAKLLKGRHPLSMQVDLQTGVANGVLVVRNPQQCAELLYKIFTNSMKFSISYEKKPKPGRTILKEEISESPFRVVTDYERLTNSFWNFFA